MGVVGHPHDVVDIAPRDDRQDRPEDLFLGDPPVVADLAEDRRRVVEAGLADPQRSVPVVGDLHALLTAAVLDVAGNAVVLLGVDDRADVARLVARVADRQRGGGVDEPGQYVVVDGLVQEEPRPGRAALPLPGETGRRQQVRDQVGVVGGVGEDDRGGLAAELQRAVREALPGLGGDPAADGRGPGEGDLVDVGVHDEGLADLGAVAGDDVEHPLGQVVAADPRERQDRQRRVLGGLDDDRVAGGQRRGDLEAGDHQRGVPRQDRADDTQRHPAGVAELVAAARQRHALDLAGDACGIPEEGAEQGGFRAGLGAQRVAGVQCRQLRERLGLVLQAVRDPQQHPRAGVETLRRPRGERGPCRRDGPVDVLRPPARRRRDDPVAVGGRDDVERLAGGGVDPSTAEEHLLAGGAGRIGHGGLLVCAAARPANQRLARRPPPTHMRARARGVATVVAEADRRRCDLGGRRTRAPHGARTRGRGDAEVSTW